MLCRQILLFYFTFLVQQHKKAAHILEWYVRSAIGSWMHELSQSKRIVWQTRLYLSQESGTKTPAVAAWVIQGYFGPPDVSALALRKIRAGIIRKRKMAAQTHKRKLSAAPFYSTKTYVHFYLFHWLRAHLTAIQCIWMHLTITMRHSRLC